MTSITTVIEQLRRVAAGEPRQVERVYIAGEEAVEILRLLEAPHAATHRASDPASQPHGSKGQ